MAGPDSAKLSHRPHYDAVYDDALPDDASEDAKK